MEQHKCCPLGGLRRRLPFIVSVFLDHRGRV